MKWTISYRDDTFPKGETWYAQESRHCKVPPEIYVCGGLTKEEAIAILLLKGPPSVIVANEVYSTEVYYGSTKS